MPFLERPHSIKGEPGDPGPVWRGQWSSGTSYSAKDIVHNGGSVYICTQAHTASSDNEPGVGANWDLFWDLFAARGEQGPQGPQGPAGLTWRGSWSSGTDYSATEAVQHGGSSYICTLSHTASADNEPGTGADWPSYWDLLAQEGGGAATFLDLTDTPNSYTNQAGKVLVVNEMETALVYGPAISSLARLGENNSDVNLFKALNQAIDTRTVELVYDTSGRLSAVYEKDGTQTVKTTTLSYDTSGRLSTVTEQVGGRTVTTTLSYDASGRLSSVSREVS